MQMSGMPMPQMPQNFQQMTPRLPVNNMPSMKLPQTRLPMPMALPGRTAMAQTAMPAEPRMMSMAALREQSFTPMKEEVLTATLSSMKMPATKENVALAKSMVQSGIPLTQENVKDLKEALAKLPSVKTSDMQAATFLKSAALATTPQNITTLSNFITMNPQLGACFFEFSKEFRKLADNRKGAISSDKMAVMSKTASVMGNLVMDSKTKGSAGNAKAFKDMAGQAGIELPSFMMGSGDDELTELLNELRKVLYYQGDEDSQELYSKLEKAFAQAEDVLMAQKLINKARREGQDNFYYLQIPVKIGNEELTAELKLYYTTDYEGRRLVDRDNFEFELLVPSNNIGDSYFHVVMLNGIMSMDVGMDTPGVADFMNRSLPVLVERLSVLGYSSGEFSAYVRQDDEGVLPMDMQEFESMEALDLSY